MRLQKNLYAMEGVDEKTSGGVHDSSGWSLPVYQFDVEINDPEFDALCRVHGKIKNFCFHGSPLENWHSILRRGLENKSHTPEQRVGAAFGPGIYFSDDLKGARHFSKLGKGWKSSQLGSYLECVGIFDLVAHPSVKVHRKEAGSASDVPERYYIVSDSRFIRLRGFLLWRDNSVAHSVNRPRTLNRMLIILFCCILLALVARNLDWIQYNIGRRFISRF